MENKINTMDNFDESIALTKENFDWNKLYPDNCESCGIELGEFAFIFKKSNERVIGCKFTILYQREELSPMVYSSKNSPIECYILLERRYNDVQGSLHLCEGKKDKRYRQAFDSSYTLHKYCVNTYGEFVRAFKTLEQAKEYAVEFANIHQYANKRNIIKELGNKDLMYKNWLRKYEGMMFYREHYKEILDIVCNYRFDEQHLVGGGRIAHEIKKTLNIDEELMQEIWRYVPLILTESTQEKAKDIVRECKEYLKAERMLSEIKSERLKLVDATLDDKSRELASAIHYADEFEWYFGFEETPELLSELSINKKGFYNIFDDNEKFIGYVGVSFKQSEPEIELYILKEFRGRGYGKEALLMAIKEVFNSNSDAFKIFSSIRKENIAAQKLMESCGFKKNEAIGFCMKVFFSEESDEPVNNPVETVQYYITREAF